MAYQGSAPLLVESVRDWLKGWLCKVSGVVVLAGCAAGVASLLTWSAADPSLTHATSGATHNLLGPLGAILSDLLMQMVGLAGVFAFLPPVFWGLQLLSAQRVNGLRAKLVMAPIAVVFLAGALASLPAMATWPLHHNYGGILGDLTLELLASLLVPINPDRAWAAAGLFYLAAGLLVLVNSLGLSQRDLQLIWQRGHRLGLRGILVCWRGLMDMAMARREPVLVTPSHRAPPATAGLGLGDSGRGSLFDQKTDVDSLAIARRFKPEGSEPIPALEGIDEPRLPTPRGEPVYQRPPHSMLKQPPSGRGASDASQAALRHQAGMLEDVLSDFGIKGFQAGARVEYAPQGSR